MSHFTRIQTQICEKDLLLQALKDLGFQYEDHPQDILGVTGRKTKVDIRLTLPGSLDAGFRKAGNAYEAVADWSGVRGIQPEKFIQQVTQRYAYHAARRKLEEQGFTLVEEKVTADDQIRLVLRRMS